LHISSDKKQQKLSKQFKFFNWEYATRVLELYMVRCKDKHKLAFYQFMRKIESIDDHKLEASFINA